MNSGFLGTLDVCLGLTCRMMTIHVLRYWISSVLSLQYIWSRRTRHVLYGYDCSDRWILLVFPLSATCGDSLCHALIVCVYDWVAHVYPWWLPSCMTNRKHRHALRNRSSYSSKIKLLQYAGLQFIQRSVWCLRILPLRTGRHNEERRLGGSTYVQWCGISTLQYATYKTDWTTTSYPMKREKKKVR